MPELYETAAREIPVKAVLITVDTGEFDAELSLRELEELARTAGAETVGQVMQKRPSPDTATYIGSGRLAELTAELEALGAELLIFDCELTANQTRNIESRTDESVWGRLGASYGQLWTAAEVLLFVLVGAAVDIRYTLAAGIPAVIMIFAALVFRSVGVLVCLAGTKLTAKERLFCVIAYLPKATVQAAMGSVPLAMGLPCGNIVLSVSVLGIIITAPLGAIGIDCTYKKLLEDNG